MKKSMSMEEVVDYILETQHCPECRQCYFNKCKDCTYYISGKKGNKCTLPSAEEQMNCKSCTLSFYAPHIKFTDIEDFRIKVAEYLKVERMREILK